MPLVPGRYRKSPMASTMRAANPTADHKIEIDAVSKRTSVTRGLLRRIIRLVRQVTTRWYRHRS